MKTALIIFLSVFLFSCAGNKNLETTSVNVKYNHLTGKTTPKYSVLEYIFSQYEDELVLRINASRKIISIQPVSFCYPYDIKIKEREAYFYSGYMSEYMQNNDWFEFKITYKK